MKKIVLGISILLLSLATLCSCSIAYRQELDGVFLNELFSDNMVLQRNNTVPVFGTGVDGTSVTVSFAGQKKTTTVQNGQWRIVLDAMEADKAPKQLLVSSAGKTATIDNVLVGDVWLCSGQSNMALTVSECDERGRTELLKIMNNPYVRLCSTGAWGESSKSNPARSAYATAFACKLQKSLDIPIGIVVRAVGATRIDQWQKDGDCYKNHIEPIKGFRFAGMLWYQGESDSTKELEPLYLEKYKALCALYRNDFEDDSLPIVATQLANCDTVDDGFTTFRLVQEECEKEVENSYLICQLDFTRSVGTIHPSNKLSIGSRAASLVMEKLLNIDGVYGTSAYFESAVKTENGYLIKFKNVHGALAMSAGTSINEFRAYNESKEALEITDAQLVSENEVLLKIQSLDDVKRITYCVATVTRPNMFDKYQNPVMPFEFIVEE